jgi:octaprenyl-diphosphate synthase
MKLAKSVIQEELKVFEKEFESAVQSRIPLLDRIMQYIVKRKGKQLRPMFVLLSAKLAGEINPAVYRAASLVELLHTATLVHDDVVDDSLERRGFFSINALWKNKIAVLVGDYLLSKGLLLSLDNNDFRVLQILSEAVRKMSEGELLQMEKSRNLNLREDVYFEIITNKTASLLSSACGAGAFAASGGNEEIANRLKSFGEKVGIAFQIKDDLFDYGNEDVGKPTGNDIKERKLTLPLIYTLQNLDPARRKKMIYSLKNENTNPQKVKEIIDIVKETGGISYTESKMQQFRDEALDILHGFSPSPVRDALEELVRYTTDRKY